MFRNPHIAVSHMVRWLRPFTCMALFLMFSAVIGRAQSLEHFLKMAVDNNPQLKARYEAYRAALEKIPQAGTLPDPQLTFNMFVSSEGLYMDRFMGQQLSEIALMQMFPWRGTRKAAQDEATYMARMKYEAYVESRNNLFQDLRSMWLQIYAVDKETAIVDEEHKILKTLEELALIRFQTGSGGIGRPFSMDRRADEVQPVPGGNMNMGNTSGMEQMPASPSSAMESMASTGTALADVLRIQLQQKELEAELDNLRSRREALVQQFFNLVNIPYSNLIIEPDTLIPPALPASFEIMMDSVVRNHPMVKMTEWNEQALDAQYRMVSLMGKPMVGVGLSYMIFRPRMDEAMNMKMGGENMLMPMVTVSLPVYRNKYRAIQNEVSIMKNEAASDLQSIQLNLKNQMEQIMQQWKENNRKLELLQQQTAIAHSLIQVLRKAYENNNAQIEDLLQQQQQLLNYRKQQLKKIIEQHLLVSSMLNLMGLDQ